MKADIVIILNPFCHQNDLSDVLLRKFIVQYALPLS